MKLFKSVLAMMLIAMLFGACNVEIGTDNKDPNEGKGSGVDFSSTDTNPAIRVRNNTSQRLVAFKGSLNADTLIGGIPAGAKNHGFKKSALFSKTEDFPMIIITEEAYIANKGNLKNLEDKPFTRVYVFYNATGENTNVYDISDRLGGNFKLVVQNPTSFNVELRLGGVNGETIGYAPKGMLTTTLYLNEGDFNIFPVFKRYNALRDILETLYPQGATGYAWFRALGFEDVPGGREKTFNVKDAADGMQQKSLGVAWLAINNQAQGAVHLVKDGAPVKSSTGVSYFQGSRTFQLDMDAVQTSNGFTFSKEKTFVLSVGPDGFEVPIKTVENNVTTLVLKADMMYTVTVTGDPNQGNLAATIELREGEQLGPTAVPINDW